MFWDSVLAGLMVLTYWETYVAGLEYLAFYVIPTGIAFMVVGKSEGVHGDFVGCLYGFLRPAFQLGGMVVMIFTLAPIIFGFAEDAAWSFPWQFIAVEPGKFFMLIGTLFVINGILLFIPILGGLVWIPLNIPLLGGTVLIFLLSDMSILGILDSSNLSLWTVPSIVKGRVDFVPSFWFSIGLIVISGIMFVIGAMVSPLFEALAEKTSVLYELEIVHAIAVTLHFIPIFMYGAWLGAQVRVEF